MSEDARRRRSTDTPVETRRQANEVPPEHRRRWLVWTLVSVLVVVGLVAGGPWVYAKLVHQDDPDPLALSSPTPSAGASAGATTGPPAPVDIEGAWVVGPGSQAGYRLGEVLSGQQVTVVGRTEEVTGGVEVTDGMLTAARVVVATDSISTDESARDAYFRRALDTTQHPEATFELTEPVDVSGVAAADAAISVSAVGSLTFHGVTQPVTATLEAQRTEAGIEVAGSIPVVLEDFGLSAPDLGFVTVEPQGTVEMLLVLTR